MRPSRRIGTPGLAALAAALLMSVPGFAPANQSTHATVDAIWRIERFEFEYRSANVAYSCNGLQAKIGAILRAVGAHPHVTVTLRCGPTRFLRQAVVSISVAIPAEASHENVIAATTFDPHTRLLAKMKRLELPTPENIPHFPARWQRVSLLTNPLLDLGPGDCDLLRSMREQVFPRLSVRVAGRGLQCSYDRATRIPPHIEVSALLAVPTPDEAAEQGAESFGAPDS